MDLTNAVEVFLGQYIPTTRRSYAQILNDLVRHFGDGYPLAQIRPVDLVRYMQIINNRPTITSPHTINKYVKTLKVFFNWCVTIELLPDSPARAIKRTPASHKVRKAKAMQDGELDELIRLAQHEPRLLALVLFAADTGARRAGMANLTWHDVHLAQSFAYVKEKGQPRRRVPFGIYTRMTLDYWKSRPGQKGDYVFSSDGAQITPAALGQYFRRRCIKAGIRSLGLHSLRHRLGHHLVENNPLSVAAKALGHRHARITAEYYSPEDDERVDRARQQLFVKPHNMLEIVDNTPQDRDQKRQSAE